MSIECPICDKSCSETEYAHHHIKFTCARLNDKPEPICPFFKLRTFRGIAGVVDHRRTSRGRVDHGPLFLGDNRG